MSEDFIRLQPSCRENRKHAGQGGLGFPPFNAPPPWLSPCLCHTGLPDHARDQAGEGRRDAEHGGDAAVGQALEGPAAVLAELPGFAALRHAVEGGDALLLLQQRLPAVFDLRVPQRLPRDGEVKPRQLKRLRTPPHSARRRRRAGIAVGNGPGGGGAACEEEEHAERRACHRHVDLMVSVGVGWPWELPAWIYVV